MDGFGPFMQAHKGETYSKHFTRGNIVKLRETAVEFKQNLCLTHFTSYYKYTPLAITYQFKMPFF